LNPKQVKELMGSVGLGLYFGHNKKIFLLFLQESEGFMLFLFWKYIQYISVSKRKNNLDGR
jgi:hypothetical protein